MKFLTLLRKELRESLPYILIVAALLLGGGLLRVEVQGVGDIEGEVVGEGAREVAHVEADGLADVGLLGDAEAEVVPAHRPRLAAQVGPLGDEGRRRVGVAEGHEAVQLPEEVRPEILEVQPGVDVENGLPPGGGE